MPLFQYFGWVGSLLLALLFAANWCVSAPNARTPESDGPFDQKINIRIHTDHKWPERVVFDTTGSTRKRPTRRTGLGGSEPPVVEERQPLDAFAEMVAIPVNACFRSLCSAGQAAEREASWVRKGTPSQTRSRIAVRKDLTFPNRLHKLPGKS
jgi:hypothetical protein